MFLLITGASGAGKSTVRAAIAPELSQEVECVELGDLVPMPATASLAWRQQTTESAVRRAVDLQASGRHLLLSGDPVAAAEVVAAPSAGALDAVAVCLLDISPEAQAARLAERGDDMALLRHHQAFAEWMRKQASDPSYMLNVLSTGGWAEMRWERLEGLRPRWKIHVIDTTDLTRRAVADAVLAWCRDVIAGRSPKLITHSARFG